MIKFLKKGMKVDEKYYPVYYTIGSRFNNGILVDGVTIYLKNYEQLPDYVRDDLGVNNESDIMTDYIVQDNIFISKLNPLFQTVIKFVQGMVSKY